MNMYGMPDLNFELFAQNAEGCVCRTYIESVPNRSIFGKDLYFRGALLHGSGFQLILVRFLSAKPA